MSDYKLMIFDFDGTLADSYPWFRDSINIAARKFSFKEVSSEAFDELRSLDSKDVIKRLEISWWKIPFLASFMRKLFTKNAHKIHLFSGIEVVLKELSKREVKLALVTSNSRINVQKILGNEVYSYFDFYHFDVSLFGKKKAYKKLVTKSGFLPSQCLSIGDEVRDIEAAKNVGISSAAVLWGYAHPDVLTLKNPTYLIENIRDILYV
jgi:phosphoglycolate phosphatase